VSTSHSRPGPAPQEAQKARARRAARARRRAADRTTNLTLGAVLASAVLTGAVANAFGTAATRGVVIAHGVLGLALLVLSPRKTRIAAASLGRPRRRPGTPTSLALAACVVAVVATGLAHATGAVELPGPLSLMQVHVGGALAAVPLAWSHYRRRPTGVPRPPAPVASGAEATAATGTTGGAERAGADGALERRAVLRVAATTAGAGLAWWSQEQGLRATGAPGAARRFTGSLPVAAGDPAQMPVTSWLDDRIPAVDPATWTLRAGRHRLDLAALAGLDLEPVTAVLDCTSAWCSTQQWSGIRLDRLLDPADLRGARSLLVGSATGYTRRLPVADLTHLWLATGVAGRPLSPGHGYPARLVAPGRRGFWWVKWVTELTPSPTPWWVQSPYPVT
jgi:DMSO/TMAO reductase YedYZ molybdopterin-dependent catalytic subunit